MRKLRGREPFAAPVAVVFVTGGGLFAFCAWSLADALWTAKQFPATAAGEYHDVVQAVYRYRHEVGAWPAELKALVPQYLVSLPNDAAYYRPPDRDWDRPVLIVSGPLHQSIEYDFGPPGSPPPQFWSLRSEGASGRVATPEPIHWPE